MWVRTQGGNMLIDCNTFKVEYEKIEGQEYYSITNDIMQGYPLARYSSKEKAMDVMDLLQLDIRKVEGQSYWAEFVFEFPQDGEVKVDAD